MMVSKQEILSFVKFNSPVIPNHIKKHFGGETYVISAVLSELAKEGQIKISNTKIGGSPTYYAVGQEFKLQDLKKYLNEKDQRTFELLKQKRILRDQEQNMLIRVGLRNIKDFAKPIEVNVRGEKEVFWRWYLTPMSEAEGLIKQSFTSFSPKKIETNTPVIEEKKPKITKEMDSSIEKEAEKEEKKNPSQKIKREEKQEVLENKEKSKEGFIGNIYDFFEKSNIEVIDENIIRKNSEIEFQVLIPSSVGKMEYFCKAKNKKKCNDGDLSSAYIKGQSVKLPILFITTGEITKKAEEMLGKEFKGMVVKHI